MIGKESVECQHVEWWVPDFHTIFGLETGSEKVLFQDAAWWGMYTPLLAVGVGGASLAKEESHAQSFRPP